MADDRTALDLSAPRRIHVTNTAGAGMSAVAVLLAQMGHRVSGHDPSTTSPFLIRLRELDVPVTAGAEGSLPADADAVVVSTATPVDHPDVAAARTRGIPVVHRAGALAAICAQRRVAAVAGTHGKTTTSALLATLLHGGAGGGGRGASADGGGDGPLVVEADESDGTFLALGAEAAIVTNVEPDHLEHWGGEDALRQGFVDFVSALSGPAVLCLDDPGASALVPAARDPWTYGTTPGADYELRDVSVEGTGVRFTLHHGEEVVDVAVPAAPGLHNARNAAAALALAHRLGVPLAAGATALGGFRGVARRFEVRGEVAGVVFVDSYDHLPTEISAALAAARAGGWRRVVCCFQPHRYSRTAALWRTFAHAFVDADRLVVTDVYPAGEPARPGVTGKLIVDAVLDAHPWAEVAWMPGLDDAASYLAATLRPGDLCLTLGAGDLTEVPDRVMAKLAARLG